MAIIYAQRKNRSTRIKVRIPDHANYAIAATFIDSSDPTSLFQLDNNNEVRLPPTVEEWSVICTAEKVVAQTVPPPVARVEISQGGDLLDLDPRANPTTVSAIEGNSTDRYRMRFVLLWPYD